MTSVYIDRRLLSVQGGDEDPHTPPAVPEALAHLAEAGLEVMVVDGLPDFDDSGARTGDDPGAGGMGSDHGTAGARSGNGRRSSDGQSPTEAVDGWLLTPDRTLCSAARRQGLRTMLVGPRSEAHRPTERCDEEARDLGAATLGILAADAMGRP